MRMKWIDDCELIVTSCIESLIIGDDFIPDISSLILNYSLISLKRIEIGDGCFKNVNQFVIDGLNELETIIIGRNELETIIGRENFKLIGRENFKLDYSNRFGSKCMIMNCDQLSEINIGRGSFHRYELFELKNLPSLISIQLDGGAFFDFHSVVFENLIRLQSINLGFQTLAGDYYTVESNELIMKNLPSLSTFKGVGSNLDGITKVILENIPSLTEDGIQLMPSAFIKVRELTCSNADSLEYYITKNIRRITPSEHVLSLHPSVFWISKINQMKQISKSVKSIMIKGKVGKENNSFKLSNLSSLVTLEIGNEAFQECHSIVFENLTRLQSIILGSYCLYGDRSTVESNELIMKNLPSLSTFKDNFDFIGKVKLENIPSLTDEGIQIRYDAFIKVRELTCSNADSLEYYITKNSHVTPSEHVLSLHPSLFWILDASQMEQISNSVESIIIKRNIGEKNNSFKLSNLSSLVTLEMGYEAFYKCQTVVFENLTRLQSITLGRCALCGDSTTVESNELIMKNLPSLSTFKTTSIL
ncbi:hypothetical protein JH06_5452 [Blastocystis sp. subtype 4]|uniref:hypothetical protein n=1 Tax=Blastocystis sp. subtype 4 TaxID=944170 RepID=UPI0007121719|nr:hypothetical protein JH06_5452 [Blastocystis sp. subtype 4]KNB43167.1 hypothetical protein JH06_5452 [Blastocystis sp. subtype 4]|eukprot:XP_014526610.1 hypothetical protein JH06_5452 [Blastocystis sp. subtype 4]